MEKCPDDILFFIAYNVYMRKLKIVLSILSVYEFVAVSILVIPNYCIWLFNKNFCEIGFYKYFLVCVMLPVFVGLLFWWENDLRKKTENDNTKFIYAILSLLINRFIKKHPNIRQIITDISNIMNK